jgi:integrase
VLLVGSGMRFGELAGLHWAQVDRANGVIHVTKAYRSATRQITLPKSKKSRTVPILPWVEPFIGGPPGYLRGATCGVPHLKGVDCPGPLMIYGPRGGVLDARTMRDRHWIPAVSAAQVADVGGGTRGLEPFRLHDLRHTAASWWLQDGATLEQVQAILGHSSLRMTQKYAHFGNTHLAGFRRMTGTNPFGASEALRTAQASGEVINLARLRPQG